MHILEKKVKSCNIGSKFDHQWISIASLVQRQRARSQCSQCERSRVRVLVDAMWELVSKFQIIFLLSKESEISKFGDGWISDDVITDGWKTLSRGLWKSFSRAPWKKLFQPSPDYIRTQRFDFHKHRYGIRKRSKLIDNNVTSDTVLQSLYEVCKYFVFKNSNFNKI